jgi:hypothetical protein
MLNRILVDSVGIQVNLTKLRNLPLLFCSPEMKTNMSACNVEARIYFALWWTRGTSVPPNFRAFYVNLSLSMQFIQKHTAFAMGLWHSLLSAEKKLERLYSRGYKKCAINGKLGDTL